MPLLRLYFSLWEEVLKVLAGKKKGKAPSPPTPEGRNMETAMFLLVAIQTVDTVAQLVMTYFDRKWPPGKGRKYNRDIRFPSFPNITERTTVNKTVKKVGLLAASMLVTLTICTYYVGATFATGLLWGINIGAFMFALALMWRRA